jgi:hypothetical protein
MASETDDAGDIAVVYMDEAGEWRWQRIAANNRRVADSGEGYKRVDAAIKAARRQEIPVKVRDGLGNLREP